MAFVEARNPVNVLSFVPPQTTTLLGSADKEPVKSLTFTEKPFLFEAPGDRLAEVDWLIRIEFFMLAKGKKVKDAVAIGRVLVDRSEIRTKWQSFVPEGESLLESVAIKCCPGRVDVPNSVLAAVDPEHLLSELETLPFNHGKLNTPQTLHLLENKEDGTFLIRPSTEAGQAVISYKHGTVRHLVVVHTGPGYRVKEDPTAATYSRLDELCKAFPLLLRKPLLPNERATAVLVPKTASLKGLTKSDKVKEHSELARFEAMFTDDLDIHVSQSVGVRPGQALGLFDDMIPRRSASDAALARPFDFLRGKTQCTDTPKVRPPPPVPLC